MKVAVVYVFPNLKLPVYEPLARRFARSYLDHPPGEHDHELHVMANLAPLNERQQKVFNPLPARHHTHNNYGKDVGAFMLAAATIPCDLMLCFGAHIHFHRAGWLDRIIDVYLKIGPGLYGCWGFMAPAPHIRTTAFWLPPQLLASYPNPVDNPNRYHFEHGNKTSILQWARTNDFPIAMVGWDMVGLYPKFKCLTHAESLMWDQHLDRLPR